MKAANKPLHLGSARAYRQVMSALSYVARFSIVFVWWLEHPHAGLWFWSAFVAFEISYFFVNQERFASNMRVFYPAVIVMILCSGVCKSYLGFVGSIFAFLSLSCMTVHNVRGTGIGLQLLQVAAYLLPYFWLLRDWPLTGSTVLAVIFDLFIYLQSLMLMFSAREIWMKKVEIRSLNKLLQEKNMELVEYMHDAQEMSKLMERTEIAQNLHDSLGHVFMAMNMNIGAARELMATDPAKAGELMEVVNNINQMGIQELSKTVTALKSTSPAQFSLRKTVEDALFETMYTSAMDVNFEMDDQVEHASPYVKNAVYALIRESFTNTLKHAGASSVHICVTLQERHVVVTYRDNGKGCGSIQKSHGLKGIEARLAAVGGQVSFNSSQGEGFACAARIPFTTK